MYYIAIIDLVINVYWFDRPTLFYCSDHLTFNVKVLDCRDRPRYLKVASVGPLSKTLLLQNRCNKRATIKKVFTRFYND